MNCSFEHQTWQCSSSLQDSVDAHIFGGGERRRQVCARKRVQTASLRGSFSCDHQVVHVCECRACVCVRACNLKRSRRLCNHIVELQSALQMNYCCVLGRVFFRTQSLVATRNRFKIVHHHAIPPQGQLPLGTRGQGPHPGPPGGGERYATNTNTSTNTNTNANANTNARIEPFHSPGVPHGLITFPPKASPSWAAASKTRVGSTLSVVIDGSEAAFSHRQTSGGWSDVGPMLAIQVGESVIAACQGFWACPRAGVGARPDNSFFQTSISIQLFPLGGASGER